MKLDSGACTCAPERTREAFSNGPKTCTTDVYIQYSDLQKVFGHLIRTLKMPVIELDNRKRVRPFHTTTFTLLWHLRNANQPLKQPLPSGFVVYE